MNDKQVEDDASKRVIVVGGGLSGLSLSLGLAKVGYRVHVVERRNDIEKRKGGTYLMQPNAIKALEEVCQEAMDPLYEMGVPIPSSECKMYAWWMVRDSLLRQVNKQKDKITLSMGWSFYKFEDDHPDFIKALFTRTDADDADADKDEKLELEGVLLVGADGVHSAVRSFLNLPPATPTGSACWRGSISVTDPASPLATLLNTPLLTKGATTLGYIKCGPCVLGLKSFHSVYPYLMTWTVNTREPDAASKFHHPRDAVGPYLRENEDTANMFTAVFELANPEELDYIIPFVTIALPNEDGKGWGGKGRVTLLGDAAHAMRSAGGQGGAMAFEDCVVLTRLLQEVGDTSGSAALGGRASTEQVLIDFENSRVPRVRKIWDDQMERAERAYTGDFGPSRSPADEDVYNTWVNGGV